MKPVLLFADDRSEGADTAWSWICAQDWTGWSVHVLTVEPVGVSHRGSIEPREWAPASPRTAPEHAHLSEIHHLVADGDPREVLAELSADLLVVGRRGQGLLKRMKIGSVAEALLECPSAPVVIPHEADPVQNVLLTVDGSTHSHRAELVLLQMPWLRNARVTILGIDEGDGAATNAVRTAADELTSHARAIDQRVVEHDPLALTVNVRHAIDEYLADHPCDVIVAGTKGLHGFKRLRLGSVADYLAHHTDCTIMLARDASDD